MEAWAHLQTSFYQNLYVRLSVFEMGQIGTPVNEVSHCIRNPRYSQSKECLISLGQLQSAWQYADVLCL